MQIPQDTGYPWRLDKFVEYQHRVRLVHPVTLCEYAVRNDLDEDDCVFLAWLMCATYSEITAIFMFERISWRTMTEELLEEFWNLNKPTLIFGSARKHAKNQNWFVPLLVSFSEEIAPSPSEWLRSFKDEDTIQAYKNIEKGIRNIRYIGRFAADLFLEIIVAFDTIGKTSLELDRPDELDWKNCSNLTSAVLNILYMDEEANQFDKTGKVNPDHYDLLNGELQNVQRAIQKRYPEQETSLSLVVGKLCSYRNLYKSSRYGGFHHDRQLGNIKKYEINYPEHKELWDMCYDMRKEMFHETLLGEVGGWDDVRKPMKKLFVQEGKTGVEGIPDNSTKDLRSFPGARVRPQSEESEETGDIKSRIVEITVTLRIEITDDSDTTTTPRPDTDDSQSEDVPIVPEEPEAEKPEYKPAKVLEALDGPVRQPNDLAEVLKTFGLRQREAAEAKHEYGHEEPTPVPDIVEDPVPTPDKDILEQEGEETGDEEMRNPIQVTQDTKIMVVMPYNYAENHRVDKTYPKKIAAAKKNDEVDMCYFPIEPFHRREFKRNATQLAIEACVTHNIPISLETRKVVPEWAIEALGRNRNSEVRAHLNTLDARKWKQLYPEASSPEEIVDSIINCYNKGAYTILRVSPIVPGIIDPYDVFQVVDRVKHWVHGVEVSFASFDNIELEALKAKIPKVYDVMAGHYVPLNGRWYVKDGYRKEFLDKLAAFSKGWKIKLKILNEITTDDADNVELLIPLPVPKVK